MCLHNYRKVGPVCLIISNFTKLTLPNSNWFYNPLDLRQGTLEVPNLKVLLNVHGALVGKLKLIVNNKNYAYNLYTKFIQNVFIRIYLYTQIIAAMQIANIWNKIKKSVPQGSILGPLLFNAFINDIFLVIKKIEICNFADDNTIYDCGEDLSNILENLNHDLKILLKWFRINFLQANPGKFQFMILMKKKFGQINNKYNRN